MFWEALEVSYKNMYWKIEIPFKKFKDLNNATDTAHIWIMQKNIVRTWVYDFEAYKKNK